MSELEAIQRWLTICRVWPLDLCISNIHRPALVIYSMLVYFR